MVTAWLTVAAVCAVTTVLVMVAVMDVLWGPLILLNSLAAVVTGSVVTAQDGTGGGDGGGDGRRPAA